MKSRRKMKSSGIPWLGDVPEGWEIVPLFKLVSQVKFPNEGMIEKNLLSLSYGRIIRKNMETASGLVPENYAGYNRIEPEDIVLRLTDLQNDQKSLRVGISYERGIVTSAYLTIRPNSSSEADYLACAIKVFDFKKGFYGIGSGVRQSLKFSEVKKIAFPLPPLPEQRAIAERIDCEVARVDALREKIKREIERLGDYKKSLIAETVTRGLRKRKMKPSGIPWLGDVPAEWEVTRLQWHIEEVTELNCPVKTDFILSLTNDRGVIPYSEKGNQGNKAKEDISGYKIAFKNSIIANSMNIIIGSVGLSQYYGCVSPVYYVFRAKDSADIRFINYIFQTSIFQRELRKYAKGILEIRLRISASAILKQKIVLPPLPEQREITAYLDRAVSRIDVVVARRKTQLEKLEAFKRSLIQEYVTGKREVCL